MVYCISLLMQLLLMFAQADIMLTHCLSFIVLMLVPLPFRAHLFPVPFLCGIIYQVKPCMLLLYHSSCNYSYRFVLYHCQLLICLVVVLRLHTRLASSYLCILCVCNCKCINFVIKFFKKRQNYIRYPRSGMTYVLSGSSDRTV